MKQKNFKETSQPKITQGDRMENVMWQFGCGPDWYLLKAEKN